MKYRLKNKELQKKLDDLWGNRFSEELNDECKRTGSTGNIYMSLPIDPATDKDEKRYSFVTFHFMREDIERFVEYNPNGWNNFPEVEPPEDVLMRVELNDGGRKCALFHHFSDGDSWCHPDGSCLPKFYSDCVTRFRPWDD